MPKIPTIWELKPHTQAKHIILRRYLQAWLPIMTTYHGRVLYIDGFAGPGIYSEGAEGSPIIALREAKNHKANITAEIVFIFIEADSKRHVELKKQVGKISLPANMKVDCIKGTSKNY